ncbi:MAG TPA: GTPase [Pirellulales bacterium]|nr:GTPase [Pirellulales bacterium]
MLTSASRGAVATILLSGPQALEIGSRHFQPAADEPLAASPIGAIRFGRFGNLPGEEIVVARRGAERLELHCHGGLAAAPAILAMLVSAGAIELTWQDWLAREDPDPIRVAARIALAAARTERAASILLDQYHGALSRAVAALDGQLARGAAAEAHRELAELWRRSAAGEHLTAPWRVVLAGPPNVGKSSLINRLLGYERAIVFDQPGTTRDALQAETIFDGWPIELTDTAGLRASLDPLEAAGVARARIQMAGADCLVLVTDEANPTVSHAEESAAEIPTIGVINKADLLAPGRRADLLEGRFPTPIFTSAWTGEGISMLQQAIVDRLVPPLVDGTALPFTAAQTTCLHAAGAALGADETGGSPRSGSESSAHKFRAARRVLRTLFLLPPLDKG